MLSSTSIRRGRILAFLYGVCIPFGNVAIPFAGRTWSLALIVATLYLIFILSRPRFSRSLTQYYSSIILFPLIWFLLLIIINLANIDPHYNTPFFNISIFSCIIMMYCMLRHNLTDYLIIRYSLWGMAAGSILMAVFFVMGISVEYDVGMRITMFGENSNMLGIYMAIGSLILMKEYIFEDICKLKKGRFVFILAYIPIVILLFATGSRTAIIVFAAFLLTGLFSINFKSQVVKFFVVVVGMFVLWAGISFFMSGDSVGATRMQSSIEDGNLSGRDVIWESLMPYIKSNPWGYGETGYVEVSRMAIGKIAIRPNETLGFSPHNVIIELLIYTGILGLLIYASFWTVIIKRSYIVYKKSRNSLALLLFIPVLSVILSGQALTAKWAFLIYTYSLSEYYSLSSKLN